MNQLSIVIIGLSITSSWGNGHAVTFRSLVKGLKGRGHDIIFLERDVPWYAQNRDSPDNGTNCTVNLYTDPAELFANSTSIIRDADLVVVGSYVPDGIRIGQWVTQTAKGVTAFYDIDTPVTLSKMKKGRCEYLAPDLIRQYDLYLSFTGGPILNHLQVEYGASAARALYCSVDTELYRPRQNSISWDLGYLGTFSTDRQPKLHELLVEPASHLNNCRFVVAGPQYPDHLQWPENVCRINHLPPSEHCTFYNSQRLTLNITRADMVRSGWSPSIRLFEAAACGIPIVSDWWEGLDAFFSPEEDILIADSSEQVINYLLELSDARLASIGRNARKKVMGAHTASLRAQELEEYVAEISKLKYFTNPRQKKTRL